MAVHQLYDHRRCVAWVEWLCGGELESSHPEKTYIAIFEPKSPPIYLTSGLFLGPILEQPAPSRIIVCAHDGYQQVDKHALRVLRDKYGPIIDDFLFSHFYWDSRGDPPKSEPATEYPPSLPSMVGFLALDYDGQIGCMVLECDPTTGNL